MFSKDPVFQAEKIVKEAEDKAIKYTQPVLRRYPLLFSFLIFFSFAALLHGFELLTDRIEFFVKNPLALIFGGSCMLFITGMLYKSLDKRERL